MVATGAVVGWGWFGCLPLGVMFLVAGLLVPSTARWAERTRTRTPTVPQRQAA
ncbi:hypothetical protein [Streptomyces sp. cg2]|uniref:hypothetical protein n=1 Tax=Streptomyces sp. cg2 TaxID=3238799 RepID=UPI0034E1FA0C